MIAKFSHRTAATDVTDRQEALLSPDNPAEALLSPSQWTEVARSLRLTRREHQVAQLLFFGLTREQIADRLQLKPRTVRQYLEQLHDKLNVAGRIGVVLRIIAVRDRLAAQKPADAGDGSSFGSH